jgi:lipoprotein-anchoring transpeptidase ErfK/SrfK
MRSSSLQSKTVRPELMNYSFYRSGRPVSRRPTTASQPHHRRGHAVVSLVVLMVVGFGLFAGLRTYQARQHKPASPAAATQAAAVSQGPQQCAGNSEAKHVIVSVGERHMWACQYHKVVYNSPVITGMEFLPADLTPRGTYQISDKQTNVTLTGSDSTGSWSDPVYYWMPFLTNEHGTYGFHDATWRPNTAFGAVDPNSKDASHGCVELPLSTSKWLYNWTQTGTTVTVKS